MREASGRLLRREGVDVSAQLVEIEDRIRATTEALDADRALLEADNAALDQQEQALWREIETLRQYAYLAARLDDLLDGRIAEIAPTDPAAVHVLRVDALYAIRRRRRDLLLQLAVATQGYSALRLVEGDNLQVIWAIRAATTTTVTALRTALLAAQATRPRPGASAGRDPEELATVVRDALHEMQAALDDVERRRRATLDAVRSGTTAGSPPDSASGEASGSASSQPSGPSS
ncbi:MAG TPA: toxic anion resistance protein [Candidatus Limnocylindrales bacterium]|nr:toxic anion resistance protein [Candidatus Limnocylindrales bacterium]